MKKPLLLCLLGLSLAVNAQTTSFDSLSEHVHNMDKVLNILREFRIQAYIQPEWQKADNFIMIEVLYFLARNRKRKGEIGLEGYFSCRRVADELQRMGYVPEDALSALNVALQRQLITADHMNFTSVDFDDSVHILASGFMHVRVLAARMEYLYGVIPTTPIVDRDVAAKLSEFVKNENVRGRAYSHQRLQAVEIFHDYLVRQRKTRETPFSASEDTGAHYVLGQIAGAIEHFKNITAGSISVPDPLDF